MYIVVYTATYPDLPFCTTRIIQDKAALIIQDKAANYTRQGCMTRLLRFSTSCSETCLTRLAKRGSGNSRRRTAFCIRSGRSFCGAIPTTTCVNLRVCVFVHGIYYYIPCILYYISLLDSIYYVHIGIYLDILS